MNAQSVNLLPKGVDTMAIQNRRGVANGLNTNKLVPGEFAVTTDTGKLCYCYAPGSVKWLATAEDLQAILDSTPAAYVALQQCILDLNSNPSELTNILSNISGLQSGKLDKTGDSKDNTVSFTEASTDTDITTGDTHATLLGKILKSIKTLRASIEELHASQPTRVDGDSFCLIGEREGNIFIDRVAKSKNFTLTNAAHNGNLANDTWIKVKAEVAVPSPYKYHFINTGFNDVRRYGNVSLNDINIKNKIMNLVAYLRLATITNSDDAKIIYTGTWNSITSENFYGGEIKYTGVQNDYAEYTFTGDKVSIGTLGFNAPNAVMEFKIDGVVKYTYDTSNQGGDGANGYSNIGIELTNLGTGSHVLRITKTDATTHNMFIDWVGVPSENPPIIIVNGLTKMETAQYTLYSPFNNGSDALILAANKAIREGLSAFDEKVIFVDQSDFDPNSNNIVLDSDHVHPNDYGHAWLADNILKRM